MNKTIYICYKTLKELQVYSSNWKKLNPDWKIELYDDNRCRDFLLKEFSQLFVDIFNNIEDGPIKSDFWRVCVIYKYGGLYVDADIQPIVPLKDYIEEDDKFVSCISDYQPNHFLNPHFLLSYKGNPILKKFINTYLKFYKENKPYSYWGWSICLIFREMKLLKMIIKDKGSQVHYINGLKFKFLQEVGRCHNNKCEYNGITVLYNRYSESIYKDHKFVKRKTISLLDDRQQNLLTLDE